MVQMIVTTDKKRLTIYVGDGMKESLDEIAKEQKRSVSNLVEVFLAEKIEEYQTKKAKRNRNAKT
ncbi:MULTISPECIES: ribbon-helix-helix domain-containing protein [Cyanophyceae]|uniref:Ribbon-helix-helix protein, CopG family n=1 Tax=Stenomitos frigidus AS-A4 TaxID=2933935 RepID=A0ABV0KF14_9CYAN|nr:ribbon-helix-helix protein, CopG family [Phormidium sp. FACHB-592]